MSNVFSLLKSEIQKILLEKDIEEPTEPQIKAIEPILRGKNVLLIAPTGLGKTESALLPVFNNFLKYKELVDKKDEGISIIYITPLRALNRDMLRRTFEWGKKLGIDIAVRHGDTSRKERARQSKNPPDMLITTPETFQILFTGKRLRRHLHSVKWMIVDEIHELAGDERGGQLSVALERLYELTSEENNIDFQRIGLSATVGSPKEVACFLGGLKNDDFRDVEILKVDVTKHIDLSVDYPTVKKNDYKLANRFQIDPISFASIRKCKNLINKHVSTLVFLNTRDGAEILSSRFHQWKKDYKIEVHHGSLSKNARIESEDAFKNGDLKALICTSSLELGIDIGDTDFVIQYNSPRQVKRILQRVGRSGHQVGKTSEGIILATSPEEAIESLVIARRALEGKIEGLKVRQNPLSVLTNQIISIALEYRRIKIDKIYNIIKRSYPFHNLKKELFKMVLSQLRKQRSIWMEEKEGVVGRKRKSRHYFLDNISMIPDEETYIAVDINSREKIGKLDESFVINNVFEGSYFILKGQSWNIIKIEEKEILVSPSKEIGNVPSWTGEDIPIPYKVALKVGKLRKKMLDESNAGYPGKDQVFKNAKKQVAEQKKEGYIIPDHQNITIDVDDKTVVINACFGTKINETLGRLISALLAQRIGESIGVNTDAYRINLELPGRISVDKIKEILLEVKPESLSYLLRTVVRNSNYIRWELVYVARKFGALRKDFDYKHVGVKKLFTLFENSLIFDEAVDKIIWERMDIENTQQVLKDIQTGEIKIHKQGLSPISTAGLEAIKGLMAPQKATRSILMALKKRLDSTKLSLVCTNCGHTWDKTVSRVREQPRCSKCNAIKIVALRRYNKNKADVLKKQEKTSSDIKQVRRLHKNASLVLSYGEYAVMTLMARGVGPDTAARILRKHDKTELKKSEEEVLKLLKDIHKAELNYARTRGFWDDNK
ncbi:MAG: DEAD/DEAH box helicase [Candidatus Thermoplasmatota archaeon]